MESAVQTSSILNHVWLELTRRCNLQCVHCYADAGPRLPLSEGLTTHDWLEVIRSARASGCKTIQLIGGEPLLHPDLENLLKEARAINFESVEVFTNTTRINSDMIGILKKYKVRIALSFYASNAECHERITAVKGSYQRTVKAIKDLLAASIPLRVGLIQVNQSEDEVSRAREWLHELGIGQVGVDHVRAVGRGDKHNAFADPLAQLPQLCGACSDGKLCIASTGSVFPCIMARAWRVGHVRDGLSHILDGNEMSTFRAKQKEYLEISGRVRHRHRAGRCVPDHPCLPDVCRPL